MAEQFSVNDINDNDSNQQKHNMTKLESKSDDNMSVPMLTFANSITMHEISLWNRQKQQLTTWLEDGENLDIYQRFAILYEIGTPYFTKIKLCRSFLKLIVCALTQILGMSYFLYTQINNEEDDGFCRGGWESDDIMLKCIAMLFAGWISMILVDQLVDIDQYGLYSFGTTQPPFTNNIIVYFGLIVNFIVIMLCWLTSLLLMYQTKNITDLILNFVAIYFMSSLDAEMVFGHDYYEIEIYFKNQYDAWLKRYIEGVNQRNEKRVHDICGGDCCEGKLIKDPGRCWVLLLPLIIIGPLYVGICH